MSKIVIVESPTKAKTISKFLGDEYKVVSSYGHLRDLPKSEIGIDVEKNFEPRYIIPAKARKNLSALKKEIKKDDEIILATDEDREGEAIAWHLAHILKIKEEDAQRIVFHEITKSAINEALQSPRGLKMNLVNAQQARRVLDRLVGYNLSPFLWKKVMRGLSAGRVQSVAVRLIYEKEKEIEKFNPEEYWSISALLKKNEEEFMASLYSKNKKRYDKLSIKNKKETDSILKDLGSAKFSVSEIKQKEVKRNPLPPFTTSTLQQAAWGKFGYSAKRTMMLAQNLYERGFITYHRTDSLSIAKDAVDKARGHIKEMGKEYLPNTPKAYKTKSKGAQEAHEAIRPSISYISIKNPEKLKLEGPQKKLFTLIWQRFLASQMNSAIFLSTTALIDTETEYQFKANGLIKKFDGFTRIYLQKFTDSELPNLKKGDKLELKNLLNDQHFTKPPARYSEASLIKELEKNGIGRPSTYAPIISTIQTRNYVNLNENKKLAPTEIGTIVTELLLEHFEKIIDIKFTATMEKDLDDIAEGKMVWQKAVEEFYKPFEKNLEEKYKKVEKKDMTEETDMICPKCGKKLLKRMGRFGWFYACSGFPECKHTQAIKNKEDDLNVHCPKCVEGEIVQKKTKKRRLFYGCNRYPDCDFALWNKPYIKNVKGTKDKKEIIRCPKCKSVLVEKNTKNADSIMCSNKECGYKQKV